MSRTCWSIAVTAVVVVGGGWAGWAEDWPAYQHDAARSGVTAEAVPVPLNEAWVHRARHAPRPAWPAPAKQDFWHELRELRPTVTYDRAFHPVAVGDTVYFASSADDRVVAIDAATGKVRWTVRTDGPVRLAPTVADGRVYFGSDDGCAYCVDAEDGSPVWKHRVAPTDHRIPGNGRMISMFPVRTGVLVDGGVAYCLGGLFPSQGVYRCALDAASGEVIWKEKTADVSPQGYLLASATRLFVPTGRTTPAIFDRTDAKYLGAVTGQGGAYALLAGDTLLSGPGRSSGQLDLADTGTREGVATYDGLRMIVNGDIAYLQSNDAIAALNRTRHVEISKRRNLSYARRQELQERLEGKENDPALKEVADELAAVEQVIVADTQAMQACYLWRQRCDGPYALILAGGTLFAGGDGKVVAVNAADGVTQWSGEVDGRAYGLAVANGALFVSTDSGSIHCFRGQKVEREYVVATMDEPDPYPEDGLTEAYAATAQRIIDETGVTKGYCLVVGSGEGRLALELAKASDLHVIGIEENARKVEAAQDALDRAGLYGVRVAVHQGKLEDFPFTSRFANLVVSDRALETGELPPAPEELWRVLRPFGGTVYIGQPAEAARLGKRLKVAAVRKWLSRTGAPAHEVTNDDGVWGMIRRGPAPNGGEWTQLYANASHTASTTDDLEGPMTFQWFGEPGPRNIIDRHHRPMSPLFKDGRVFVPGDDVVVAVDAYNGTPLWRLEIPNSRRVGALKNSGHMILADDYLYIVTENQCWAVEVATGERAFVLEAPQHRKVKQEARRDWGYFNRVDDRLYGTSQKPGASFNELSKDTVNMLEGDFRPVMVSESLFSMDRFTGKVSWHYRNGGILNAAITMGDGRIYFVESRNEPALEDEDGRIRIDRFCKPEALVMALDAKSGKKVWEQPFTFPFQHIMHLTTSQGVVLATGTFNEEDKVFYGLYAFDAKTGEPKWDTRYLALDTRGREPAPTGGSHGEQWQHPVIVGDRIFLRPHAFDLATGEKLDYIAYRGGHGCGGLTGSVNYLYGRGNNPRMYPIDVKDTDGVRLTHVSRPGCWLNVIPVGGLVLIPESSSGCTCAYPMQTSFALIPKALSGLDL